MSSARFFIGEWQVNPADNTISLGKTKRTIEPKAMDVLLLLCQFEGEVVSADDIIDQCWPHQAIGDNPVHKAITQLRRAFNDKASAPAFIETIRKRGYRIVAKVTFPLNESEKAQNTTWTKGSPYPGLASFTENESAVFFGRASAIDGLLQKLDSQRKARHLLTIILGPSGSGKSSLVQAGVVPRLKSAQGYSDVRVISDTYIDAADITPQHLFSELASALLDLELNDEPVFVGFSSDTLASQLQSEPESLSAFCLQRLNFRTDDNKQPLCLLVFDRLEAILATSALTQQQKDTFFHAIDCLASNNALLIYLLCRNDFYPQLTHFPVLMRHKNRGGHFDLQSPSAIEVSQMVRLPAAAASLQWETHNETGIRLDEVLCADAMSHADGLPLLQYTLQELYLQRQDNVLTFRVYQALGGVEGAIGKKAEDVFLAMPAHVQQTFSAVMVRLINLNQQEEQLTSRSVQWSTLKDDNEKHFVEFMVEHRLFVSHLHQQEACFNVAHEALLRRWQRVKDWVAQHHAALLQKNRLAQQTRQWLKDNKSQAFVLTEGKPLTDALAVQADSVIALSEDEQELIAYSVSQRNRKRWLKRGTVTMLAGLTFFSVLAMFSSQQSQQLAERKRLEAEDLMGYMIGDFADKLRSVRRMDLLEGISQQALRYVESSQKQHDDSLFSPTLPPPSFTLRLQHAKSLQAMAEVRYYRDDAEEAKTYYQDAELRLTQLLQEAPDNVDVLKAAGLNAFWLGQLAYDEKDYKQATTDFTHYQILSEKLVQLLPSDKNAKLELAYALNSVGSAQLNSMEFEKAIDNFEQSLALKERLSDPEDGLDLLYFVNSYLWISNANLHLGRLDNALSQILSAEKKLSGLNELAIPKENTDESLMYLLTRKAEIKYFDGDKKNAVKLAIKAKNYAEQLLEQDPDNSVWKRDYAIILIFLAKLNAISSQEGKTAITVSDVNISELISTEQIPQLISVVNAYQSWEEWKKSAELLVSVEKSKLITTFRTSDATLHIEEVLTYSEYLMSEVVQRKHDNHRYTTPCLTLGGVIEPYTARSHHPTLHVASVFSEVCKYESADLNNMTDDVRLVIKQHPEYFSLFIKDM